MKTWNGVVEDIDRVNSVPCIDNDKEDMIKALLVMWLFLKPVDSAHPLNSEIITTIT